MEAEKHFLRERGGTNNIKRDRMADKLEVDSSYYAPSMDSGPVNLPTAPPMPPPPGREGGKGWDDGGSSEGEVSVSTAIPLKGQSSPVKGGKGGGDSDYGHDSYSSDDEGDYVGGRMREPDEEDRLVGPWCGRGDWSRSARPDGRGPMGKPRKCRDLLFLLLFVLVWGGWLVLGWVVITDGCPGSCNDPRRLIFGTDSITGEVCGTGNQTGKARLYVANPVDPMGRKFCVESCPSLLDGSGASSVALGLIEGDASTIRVGADAEQASPDNCFLPMAPFRSDRAKGCFYPTYASYDILYKCVPLLPKNITDASKLGLPASLKGFTIAAGYIASPVGILGNAVSEIQVTWPVIVALCLLAVVLGFLWLLMLRGCAMMLIMGTILLFALALIGLTLLAWDKAGMIRVASVYNELAVQIDAVQLSPPVAEAVAVIISGILICYLLLVCCMFKRIRIAVRLIQESARAVVDMPSMVFFPVSTFAAFFILCAWSVVIGLYLASAGEFDPILGSYSFASRHRLIGAHGPDCADKIVAMNPLWVLVEGKNETFNMGQREAERYCVVYGGDSSEAVVGWQMSAAERVRSGGLSSLSQLPPEGRDMSVKDWLGGGFREALPFDVSDYYQYFWVYHVFAFLWTYMFLLSCLFMSISGAVASWYWREEGEPLTGLPLVRSFLRLLSYQLGTAAFGSFIVSLIWMARISFQLAAKRLKVLRRVPAAGAVLCMVHCCLGCVEWIMKYINRNAVIVAAMHGEGYCWSAGRAFSLLMSNILRVAAVSVASMSLIIMGKLFITAVCVLSAYAWLTTPEVAKELNVVDTPVTTLVVVGLAAWLIARLFLNVFVVVIDSVLLCFFEDSGSDKPLPTTRFIGGVVKKEMLFDKDEDEERGGKRAKKVRGRRPTGRRV